jgi:hypothetical protein
VPELLPLLWELDVFPDLEMLSVQSPDPFLDRDQALALSRRMTYVVPLSEQDARLQSALDVLAEAVAGGIALRGAVPVREVLVSWPGK